MPLGTTENRRTNYYSIVQMQLKDQLRASVALPPTQRKHGRPIGHSHELRERERERDGGGEMSFSVAGLWYPRNVSTC